MKKIGRGTRGSATIEAVVSFTAFIFVIFTILGVINYCRVQSLVSTAVDNTAKELSEYSYFYKMSGLDKLNNSIEDVAEEGKDVVDEGKSNVDNVIRTVDGLFTAFSAVDKSAEERSGDIQSAIEGNKEDIENLSYAISGLSDKVDDLTSASDDVMTALGDIQENPVKYMKSLVAISGGKGLSYVKSHLIAAPLAKAFTTKHFGDNKNAANIRLKSLGVVDGLDGMNFKMSEMFTSPHLDEIHIVVYYKVKLFQFFGDDFGEVTLCKEATTRAWLGGDSTIKNVGAEEDPPEEETSLWELYKLSRGKEITAREKEEMKTKGYYTSATKFDVYDKGSNMFYQYRTIDPLCKTYKDNDEEIIKTMTKDCEAFKKVVAGLGEKLKMFDKDGNETTVDSVKGTRKIKYTVIFPDDTSISDAVINSIKAKFPDIEIEIKYGYGKSPNDKTGDT